MGSEKTLLIVDPDDRSLRVLEVTLRKAGFRVLTAVTAEAADRIAAETPPDVLVTDTQLPDEDGFALARRIRDGVGAGQTALVFLSSEASPEAKMRGIEAGADDFLAKPVLVKEIVSRLRALIASRETETMAGRGQDGHLRGALANMGVVDIVQVMEAGSKSGVVHLISDPERSGGYVASGEARATLYFRDGQMVDGQLGGLSGAEALYRVLLWEDGDFEMELVDIDRPDLVQQPTQLLLLEGMRRVDEWSRLLEKLPKSTGRHPTVDYAALGRRFGDVPAEVRAVVHLLDGERTLFQVVDQLTAQTARGRAENTLTAGAPIDDATVVGIITRLNDEGILVSDPEESSPPASIEAWLSGDIPEPTDIPSALGQAVIPSAQSPSEILEAAVPRAHSEPEPQTPEAVPRTPSIVLSRRTVPANRFTETPEPSPRATETPFSDETGRPPRLSIQRVSSIIQPASPVAAPAPASADAEVTQESRVPAAIARASAPSAIDERGHPAPAPRGHPAPAPRGHPAEPPAPRTSEVQAPAPVFSRAALAQQAELLPNAPREVPEGAFPSDEPSLVIASRTPGAPSGNGHSNGHFAVVARPADTATETSSPSSPAAPSLAGSAAPAESVAEEDFFSGTSAPTTEPAAPGEIDWGEVPPRSTFERLAPWGLALALLLVVGVLIAQMMSSEGGEMGAQAELEKARVRQDKIAALAADPSAASAAPGATGAPEGTAAASGAEGASAPTEGAPAPTEGAPAPEGSAPTEGASEEARANPASSEKAAASPAPKAAASSERTPTSSQLPARAPEQPRSGRAESALADAENALRGQDFEAAKSRFKTALRFDRRSAAARSGLAYALLAEENLGAARSQALDALRIDERDARAQLVLGAIAQNRGDLKNACRRYRRYLELGGGPRASEIRSVVEQRCAT